MYLKNHNTMNSKKIFLFIFSIVLVAYSCKNNDPVDEIPTDIEMTLKSVKLVEADNQFGLELFKKINETDVENKNIMISPLSVSLALAMAYNGAEGETRAQMEEMLHKVGLTPDEINQSYKTLVDALKNHDAKVVFEIANAIFYDKDFSVKSDFLNTNKSSYNAEIKALDFGDSGKTLKTINDWVNDKTHKKIDKILDQISPYDMMVLLNAVYFNGEWTYRFEKENTTDKEFHLSDGTSTNVPTMMIEEDFNYYGNNQIEMLELPYGGGKYSMVIFLPKEGTSIDQTIGLLTPENMETWYGEMVNQSKTVYLPRFEFAYGKKLNDELMALGMIDAFNGNANFKGITDAMQLFISDVIHKSYIKVDEKGTEAAAVTAVVIRTTSAGPGSDFVVNHPFAFAIKEKDTNAILFIGKVLNPKQN